MAKKKSRSQRARAKARKTAATPVIRGQQAFHRGDYDEAIAAWEQALQEDPSPEVTAALAEVCFRRGLSRFHNEGDKQAGLTDLVQAANLIPDDPRYTYHLGLAHHHLGNLDAALKAYQVTLDSDPTFGRAAEMAVLATLEQGHKPQRTAAWSLLPPDRRPELELVAKVLAGRPAAAHRDAQAGDRSRLWEALEAWQAQDPTSLDELLEVARDQSEPPAVRALAAYALGADALRRDRQEEALGHWQAAQRLGFDAQTFLAKLGRLYYAQAEQAAIAGRWIDAAALADAARELASGETQLTTLTSTAHFHAGYIQARDGQWQHALVHWEKARGLGENSRELLQNLALAYEEVERYYEAADLWRQVVRRRPRKATAPDALSHQQVALLWEHVAECYRRSGDVDEAIKTLRNAVKNDPDSMDLRLRLVDALIAQDRWEAAGNETDRILAKEPQNLGALVRSGRVLEASWYPGSAQPIWRQVLALDPQHLEARERLSESLERQADATLRFGSAGRALELFREALTYMSEEPDLYLSCADCHLRQNDIQAARAEMERAFALQTDDLSTYHSAVDLCHFRKRPEVAEWVIARAEALAGPHQPTGRLPASFFLDLAECGFKRLQTEVGNDYLQRAEEAAAGDADGLVEVALVYADHDDLEQMVTLLNEALRLDPGHGLANLHIGMTHAMALDIPAANRHWRLARRTARQTGDTELLKMVQAARRYVQQAMEALERGLPPPPFFDLDPEMFHQEDDADWN